MEYMKGFVRQIMQYAPPFLVFMWPWNCVFGPDIAPCAIEKGIVFCLGLTISIAVVPVIGKRLRYGKTGQTEELRVSHLQSGKYESSGNLSDELFIHPKK